MSDFDDPQTFTDQAVYIVYEYRDGSPDGIEMIFEDDADTLSQVIEYADCLSNSDSRILTGDFHAANPGEEHLRHGDWYLEKRHGVGISHGLCDDVCECDDTDEVFENVERLKEELKGRVEEEMNGTF